LKSGSRCTAGWKWEKQGGCEWALCVSRLLEVRGRVGGFTASSLVGYGGKKSGERWVRDLKLGGLGEEVIVNL
jgi:hypothetical protein